MQQLFQWEGTGVDRFRIVIGDKASDWTTYRGIARLDFEGQSYFGVSAFYSGTFPIEKVLRFLEEPVGAL